jgi:hypothetical protein
MIARPLSLEVVGLLISRVPVRGTQLPLAKEEHMSESPMDDSFEFFLFLSWRRRRPNCCGGGIL